jgi:pimeloyl-ACP methyl ester carboxylesterase
MSATVSVTIPTPRGPEPLTVSYLRVGTGEPLLLLHGTGRHPQAWDPVIPVLAVERDAIAVDLPGRGGSSPLPAGLAPDLPTAATVLAALCERWRSNGRTWRANRWRPAGPGTRPREARTVRHRTVPGRVLVTGRAPVRLRGSQSDAARGAPDAPAGRRAAGAVGGRPRDADEHDPCPAGPACARGVVAETLAPARAEGFDGIPRTGREVRFTDAVAGVPVTVAWGSRDRPLVPRPWVPGTPPDREPESAPGRVSARRAPS